MSPHDKAANWAKDLARKLREDLASAEDQARWVDEELSKSGEAPGRAAMAFVSVCIDRAHTAIESGLLRIARVVDGVTPAGDGWHKALLHQMTLPIQDGRPAALSSATAADLDVLRRHRHWLRHAYAASFEWGRMEDAVRALPRAMAGARADLERFIDLLDG